MALSPALRAKVAQSKARYQTNNSKTTKPKEGRNQFRILAPTHEQADWVDPNDGQWWAELGVHWIKPAENAKPLAVVGDPETTFGEPGQLSAVIEKAIANATDEDSKKLYESWRARKSILLNVIDRSEGDKVTVLELSPTTFAKVLEQIEEYDEADQDITDPVNGLDIVITRVGKGLNTEYSVMVAPVSAKNPQKPVTKEQMAEAVDLPAYIRSNFFRGEERKALAAVSNIAGIAVPAKATLNLSSAAVSNAAVTSQVTALQQQAQVAAQQHQQHILVETVLS